jgi:hypothetical protein
MPAESMQVLRVGTSLERIAVESLTRMFTPNPSGQPLR